MAGGRAWLSGLGLAGLVLIACSDRRADGPEVDPEVQAQFDACVESLCFKLLSCEPTLEPTEDFAQECRDSCEALVADADAAACSEILSDLIACAEASSCEDYVAWSLGEGSVCGEPEATLRDGCGVDIRDAG